MNMVSLKEMKSYLSQNIKPIGFLVGEEEREGNTFKEIAREMKLCGYPYSDIDTRNGIEILHISSLPLVKPYYYLD